MAENVSTALIDHDKWTGRLFGGAEGSWYQASETREVIEPATGERLANIGLARAADVKRAAQAAAAAQPAWAALPPRDRAAIMRRAAAALERNLEEAARYIARETGGIPAKAQLEVAEAATQLHIASGLPLAPQGLVLPSPAGRTSYARRVPHGVVGVISPFNFPLILSMRSVAPALAMGNAVVLKPDPQTPISGGFLIARAFEEAGLPPGVLQVVPGDADAGAAVVDAPEVRMIAFTGSTAAGRKVGELAGRLLKKVSLELGGKNTLIVLDDADLDVAASNAAFGAFFHQGQICMATGRILAHRSMAAELTKRLVEKANTLPVGDPASGKVAIGPLINARQLSNVDAIVQASIHAGAVLEAGGVHERLFYRPTVLSNVQPGMRAFDEEIFGPVAVVTPFDSDDEAVELANRTEYGLSCAVIGTSLARATAVGERLKSGLLHINGQTVADECVNPFGGRGDSGNGGSMGGPADVEEYTQWQWVTVKGAAERTPF